MAGLRALLALALGALIWGTPLSAADPDWPDSITIATGSPGGTYHAYGEGLARLLTRRLGIRVSTVDSGGPSENLGLVASGRAQIGFVTLGIAHQAQARTGDFADAPAPDVVALFPMYDTPFQFVTHPGFDGTEIADLAGKRIGVGPDGGTAETYGPAMLAHLGIEARYETGTWQSLTERFRAGDLDAMVIAGGVPFPSVQELEAAKDVRYLTLTPDQILSLKLAFPEINPSTIPAGSYASLNRGYPTVGVYNFAIAAPGLPDSLVYEVLSTVFARHQDLIAIHPAAASTIPRNFIRNSVLPFHPGAASYYANTAVTGLDWGD